MSLSDKIIYHDSDIENKYGLFNEWHVREAVKELKKSIEEGVKRNNVLPLDWCFNRIDEIFGEKLI